MSGYYLAHVGHAPVGDFDSVPVEDLGQGVEGGKHFSINFKNLAPTLVDTFFEKGVSSILLGLARFWA